MVAIIENYTFSEDAKINMDKRGIKTGYENFLFPLHFKPSSNIEVVEQKFSLFENNSNFKPIKPAPPVTYVREMPCIMIWQSPQINMLILLGAKRRQLDGIRTGFDHVIRHPCYTK